jgi:hypothetical protein
LVCTSGLASAPSSIFHSILFPLYRTFPQATHRIHFLQISYLSLSQDSIVYLRALIHAASILTSNSQHEEDTWKDLHSAEYYTVPSYAARLHLQSHYPTRFGRMGTLVSITLFPQARFTLDSLPTHTTGRQHQLGAK